MTVVSTPVATELHVVNICSAIDYRGWNGAAPGRKQRQQRISKEEHDQLIRTLKSIFAQKARLQEFLRYLTQDHEIKVGLVVCHESSIFIFFI